MNSTRVYGAVWVSGAIAITLIPVTNSPVAYGQSITPNLDGVGTQVEQAESAYTIIGGTASEDGQNLFHSFETFGLNSGELANFITQPAVLNVLGRINGGQPSIINGTLQLTGSAAHLYFLNPVGILFGPDASLNLAGSFTATTAAGIEFGNGLFDTIGTTDYTTLVGSPQALWFSQPQAGSVVNAGDLQLSPGKSLTLAGGTVVNTGQLQTAGGHITLATVPGSQWVRLSPTGSILSYDVASSAVENNLTPLSLPALLTGQGVPANFGLTVTDEGSVQLGQVEIPTTVGTTIASGRVDTATSTGTGGTITLLGETTGTVAALLTTTGSEGGGTLRVGGDHTGTGSLPNSEVTYISADSILDASATENGEGGKIILWSNQTTRTAGQLRARGGAQGGNGGFIETSSGGFLDVAGVPDMSAPAGQAGTWLIDPNDINIIAGVSSNINQVGSVFTPTADSALLGLTQLLTALGTGGTVVISTVGSVGSQPGNITLSTPLNYSLFLSAATLQLEAAGSIFINQPIQPATAFPFGLNLNLIADADNLGTNGQIQINAGIATNGGSLNLSANTSTGLAIETVNLNSGPLTINGFGGDIVVGAIRATGPVTIQTDQFFRVTNTILGNSLQTTGFPITITHGGGGTTPFAVGNASLNGTLGNLDSGTEIIAPTQSFVDDYIQGNIQILTNVLLPEEPLIEETPSVPETVLVDCFADCLLDPEKNSVTETSEDLTDTLTEVLTPELEGNFAEVTQTAIDTLETDYSHEFTDYLGLSSLPEPALPKTQEELTLVAEATGIRPAILYVSFVPPTTENLNPTPQVSVKTATADPWATPGVTARLPQPTDLLELILVTPDGPPIRKTVSITQAQVQQAADQLRNEVVNDTRLRSRTYLNAAQQLYDWLIAPLSDTLSQQAIGNLAFVMPSGLRSLPVSTLHDGEAFLIEHYSVGLMPSVSLTDLRYVDVRNTEVLAMGASSFQDQPALPAVPIELSTITDQLWPGDFFLNETFTPDSLVSHRQQKPYGIVHLATHGEFRSGRASDSYIQFWDQRMGIDQVRSLQLNAPPVELMVLSACQMALGDEEAELGFAGLAVQAGVKTALASLWKVDDVGTAGLMTEFYTSLRTEPIKAEALRQAQIAMLQGKIQVRAGVLYWPGGEIRLPPELRNVNSDVFSHPYFWASFTVIGSPW